MMIALILFILLFGSVLHLGLRLSWGILKLAFGLITFALMPVLLVLSLLGVLIHAAAPILLIGFLCYLIFHKAEA